ncbi:hypothetical protein BT93_K2394 [Corymbia citriodora subsp. variegata]|nr:hypothetical protein BT93_K2394 [Corymbia citriodora subsp. variegata]
MASSRYQVEVTLIAAKDLKNVNWRYGPLRPYAVVWADPNQKCSTRADPEGDSFPVWDQTLLVPLPPGAPVDDVTLHVDIVHAGSEDGTKPLIGSARLRLRDVLDDDNGYGGAKKRSLLLKRPSGRPHGKVDVKVAVRESRYRAPPTAYGAPPPQASREYAAPPAYGSAYGSAYSNPYASPQPQYEQRDPYYPTAPTAPPAGYPSYSGSSYGQQMPSYGQEEKKKSKFGGMGTGLAVGAVAGVLGGIALTEGAEYVENKIADNAAEKAEDDLADRDDGDDYQDDDY